MIIPALSTASAMFLTVSQAHHWRWSRLQPREPQSSGYPSRCEALEAVGLSE